MGIVQELAGKIKGTIDKGAGEWGIPILVVLIGMTGFGLGRLSILENVKPAVSVESAAMQPASAAFSVGGAVVASKSGSAYHFPWCGGATTIKEANKVWFKSEEAAKAAGYSPAKNCKGLK